MEFRDLPKDVIKLIIEFCPYGQWFRLSKELNTLASQVISPVDHRISENGALCWSLTNSKILAATSLLKDPRIDPSVHYELLPVATVLPVQFWTLSFFLSKIYSFCWIIERF
jgi:hypothetical protein